MNIKFASKQSTSHHKTITDLFFHKSTHFHVLLLNSTLLISEIWFNHSILDSRTILCLQCWHIMISWHFNFARISCTLSHHRAFFILFTHVFIYMLVYYPSCQPRRSLCIYHTALWITRWCSHVQNAKMGMTKVV